MPASRSFCLLLVALSIAPAARAQTPLGGVVASFDLQPSKVLADPARQRVYATDLATNSLVVIGTETLQPMASVPVGSNPADMSISPDGATLYVANRGSNLSAISVIDLVTLAVSRTLQLPSPPSAIAAGLDGRLYAALTVDSRNAIYQFDAATGTVQTTFDPEFGASRFLEISPDRKTLYVASRFSEPGDLVSFDVSMPTPAALQTIDSATENIRQLVVSNTGKYVCAPSGGGNPGAGNYSTWLFSGANIEDHFGALATGAYPGPLAFSPDDSRVYQTQFGTGQTLQVFNASTFVQEMEIKLYPLPDTLYAPDVTAMTVDRTGSYAFIAESIDIEDKSRLLVVGTGAGALTPPVPEVSIATDDAEPVGTVGSPVTLTVSRTGNLSRKVFVDYAIKGSARNGEDFSLLTGRAKLKANVANAKIVITPLHSKTRADTLTLKLKLLPSASYDVSEASTAKVKIAGE